MSNELKSRKKSTADKLKRFVPEGFENFLADLIYEYPVTFKIVPPRSTKLGDFRPGLRDTKSQITVNGDLNKYSFLITSVHEFAHLRTFLKYGVSVKPHGEEWKQEYRKMLLPLIDSELLPEDIRNALVNSLISTKASSCSDIQLSRILKKYDVVKTGVHILESLPKNTTFVLQGKTFVKGELRRKRFLCEDLQTARKYLVHALSEVKIIE